MLISRWLFQLTKMFKLLVATDSKGDWDVHLQVIQDIVPVFREFNNNHYLRYTSWYFEKKKKLPPEYPAVYQEFKRGSVVKTSNDFFQMYFFHLV